MDPLWAVLSDNTKRFDGWLAHDFFKTGAAEIAAVMERASALGYPAEHKRVLDFGCGIGRISRALQSYFGACTGVDISSGMIERAREMNPRCEFVLLQQSALLQFPARHFDMVYSNIVLQHQRHVQDVWCYVSEFLRILRDRGLLVFQLPHYIPVRYRLQARRRLYHILRALGFQPQLLYRRFRLDPIRMLAVPQPIVVQMLTDCHARVLQVVEDRNSGPCIDSRTYYVTHA
jgi:SAM-dependent methyltransferase